MKTKKQIIRQDEKAAKLYAKDSKNNDRNTVYWIGYMDALEWVMKK